jgi:hypothetical protein
MHNSMNGPDSPITEPCGGPSTATPLLSFLSSKVSRNLEIKETGTVNYTVWNTLLPRVYKKAVLTFCDDK